MKRTPAWIIQGQSGAKKGFPDIFRRLREGGIPYGIATSDVSERARRSVARYDDDTKLCFVLSPEDVPNHKPSPDMLLRIATMCSTKPEHIMMIGDSYVDMLMAKNAGAIGVGIPEFDHMRERMRPIATVMVDSLDDIHVV